MLDNNIELAEEVVEWYNNTKPKIKPEFVDYAIRIISSDNAKKSGLKDPYKLYTKLRDIPDNVDIIDISNFVDECDCNDFIDDDGFGEFIINDRLSGITFSPSEICNKMYDLSRISKVAWYNR
jgi:hypothetical protein